jgi:hypothetical protein
MALLIKEFISVQALQKRKKKDCQVKKKRAEALRKSLRNLKKIRPLGNRRKLINLGKIKGRVQLPTSKRRKWKKQRG